MQSCQNYGFNLAPIWFPSHGEVPKEGPDISPVHVSAGMLLVLVLFVMPPGKLSSATRDSSDFLWQDEGIQELSVDRLRRPARLWAYCEDPASEREPYVVLAKYLPAKCGVPAMLIEAKRCHGSRPAGDQLLFAPLRRDCGIVLPPHQRKCSRRLGIAFRVPTRSALQLGGVFCSGVLIGSLLIWLVERDRVRASIRFATRQMDIAASVSHALRTPISAILTAGENIRDCLTQGNDTLHEQGAVITAQAIRMMDLVDQFLVYVGTGKSRTSGEMCELSVADVFDDALRSVSILLQKGEFSVEREIQPGLPVFFGNLSLLSLCLQNLLTNAMKYGGPSRWFAISAHLEAGRRAGEEEIQISVRDRGLGISKADRTHIFEPFYRSRRPAVSRIRGSGLGLAIAKRGIEACGGSLSFVSEEGVGSEFTIHVPLRSQLTVAPRQPEAKNLG